MVASTTETSFNKIDFNQKNFHVLLFIYRLKLKELEKLNGNKNHFKLWNNDLIYLESPKKVCILFRNELYTAKNMCKNIHSKCNKMTYN